MNLNSVYKFSYILNKKPNPYWSKSVLSVAVCKQPLYLYNERYLWWNIRSESIKESWEPTQ